MEQKKTLWIIAAVGTFLLVVLGTAGILYSPSKNSTTEIAKVETSATGQNKQNSGWKNDNNTADSEVPVDTGNTLPASPQKVDEMVVVSNKTTIYDLNSDENNDSTTTIDLNALKTELNSVPELQTQPQNNININVTVPDNTNKVVKAPEYSSDSEYSSKISAPDVQAPKKETVKETPKKAVPDTRKSQPAKAQKPAPAPKQAAPKKVTQYWVQVASYSNKKAAESAKLILDDNKISSDIFTYEDGKDDLYYRVRIGPYTTKSEAEYWKSRVLKITYFKDNDSYITSTVK